MATPYPVDHDATEIRLPPHSVEAERSVLGALILNPEAWDKIADVVVEDDFYRHDHRLFFRAIETLAERNAPRDAVTVTERLESTGDLAETGGLPYLCLLYTSPSPRDS